MKRSFELQVFMLANKLASVVVQELGQAHLETLNRPHTTTQLSDLQDKLTDSLHLAIRRTVWPAKPTSD